MFCSSCVWVCVVFLKASESTTFLQTQFLFIIKSWREKKLDFNKTLSFFPLKQAEWTVFLSFETLISYLPLIDSNPVHMNEGKSLNIRYICKDEHGRLSPTQDLNLLMPKSKIQSFYDEGLPIPDHFW